MDENKHEEIKKSFWEKIKNAANKAGREVVEKAFILYYCFIDKDTPGWAKSTIMGALVYFISPVDAIPDAIPGAGYSDDLAVIAGALVAVSAHIKPEHKEKAKEQVEILFGSDGEEGLDPSPSPAT